MDNAENHFKYIKFREGGIITASSLDELLAIDSSLENIFKFDEINQKYKPLND